MPETDSPKRQQPRPLVELATGIQVHDEFVQHVPMPGNVGFWRVHVRVDDDRVLRLVSFGTEWIEQPKVVDVSDERQRRVIELAISKEAVNVATSRMISDAGATWGVSRGFLDLYGVQDLPIAPDGVLFDAAELDDIDERVRASVRPKPGRRPVDADLKARALKVFRDEGIEAAMSAVDRKERTVRRWIADAKAAEDAVGDH